MQRISIWRIGLMACLAVGLLLSCDSTSPAPTVSPLGSPVAAQNNASSPISFPPPLAGFGAATGRLVAGSADGPGYQGGDLYLGTFIAGSDPNAQPMIAFSEGSDPKAVVHNPDGTFAFTNVPPGTYALVSWTPVNSFVLESPGSGAIKVEIKADQTTDLGTIVVP
jgi:hypothetical protein